VLAQGGEGGGAFLRHAFRRQRGRGVRCAAQGPRWGRSAPRGSRDRWGGSVGKGESRRLGPDGSRAVPVCLEGRERARWGHPQGWHQRGTGLRQQAPAAGGGGRGGEAEGCPSPAPRCWGAAAVHRPWRAGTGDPRGAGDEQCHFAEREDGGPGTAAGCKGCRARGGLRRGRGRAQSAVRRRAAQHGAGPARQVNEPQGCPTMKHGVMRPGGELSGARAGEGQASTAERG
jgi:hypothetical protein